MQELEQLENYMMTQTGVSDRSQLPPIHIGVELLQEVSDFG